MQSVLKRRLNAFEFAVAMPDTDGTWCGFREGGDAGGDDPVAIAGKRGGERASEGERWHKPESEEYLRSCYEGRMINNCRLCAWT